MDLKLIVRTPGKPDQTLPQPSQVEVREQLGQTTTFTITYSEDVCDNEFQLLKHPALNPMSELEILVQAENQKIWLVRGLVQGHQITLKHGGQGSQLQVNGSDNSIRLGWIPETKNWGKRITTTEIYDMLSKVQKNKKSQSGVIHTFDEYHIMGQVFPKEANPGGGSTQTGQAYFDFKNSQHQREDDLAFIRRLASQKGHYFWVSYDDQGAEIANFEKLLPLPTDKDSINKNSIPDITLKINAENNDLDDLSISWDCDRPTSVEGIHTDRKNKEDKKQESDSAPQPKLGNVTLGELTQNLISAFQSPTTGDESDLKERNDAALNEAEWFIKASCSTSYERLCKNHLNNGIVPIIHAHTLVNIEGAGTRHSGKYLVAGVTHSLDGVSYKMQLELKRNAWTRTTEDVASDIAEAVVGFISKIF